MTQAQRMARNAVLSGLKWGLLWLSMGLLLLLIAGPDIADVPFPLGFGALGFGSGVLSGMLQGAVMKRKGSETMGMTLAAVLGAGGGALLASAICTFAIGSGNETTGILVMIPVLATAGAVTALLERLLHRSS